MFGSSSTCLLFDIAASCPSYHSFGHVRTCSCLPGLKQYLTMRGSLKFCRRGSNFDVLFSNEGR